MLDDLFARFRRGDRNALSRLLSLAARGEHLPEIRAALLPAGRPCRVVAVTGSAGVGKSTLVGKLLEVIRGQGQSVAVLACDPQSPLSGGALLGDRFRMPTRPDDSGVYIRSLAAAADHGAIADNLGPMVRLLASFGFDVVLIETVGAGQGDTSVRHLADVVVLLLQPETGDDLQWEKAGVLEVADVIVVHKADLPGAERVASQVQAILGLSGEEAVPVLRVSARTGQGLDELWQVIQTQPAQRWDGLTNGRDLLQHAQAELARRFEAGLSTPHPELQQLLADWSQGRLDQSRAVDRLLRLLADDA